MFCVPGNKQTLEIGTVLLLDSNLVKLECDLRDTMNTMLWVLILSII